MIIDFIKVMSVRIIIFCLKIIKLCKESSSAIAQSLIKSQIKHVISALTTQNMNKKGWNLRGKHKGINMQIYEEWMGIKIHAIRYITFISLWTYESYLRLYLSVFIQFLTNSSRFVTTFLGQQYIWSINLIVVSKFYTFCIHGQQRSITRYRAKIRCFQRKMSTK